MQSTVEGFRVEAAWPKVGLTGFALIKPRCTAPWRVNQHDQARSHQCYRRGFAYARLLDAMRRTPICHPKPVSGKDDPTPCRNCRN
ncbi:unnamed protein product [Protopolystoma xenopodis]|uniref:Uncharacterized protein n=1 Tax=Protopolystoma xenopodis TaxID=117903 RepID=A0A3S4ZD35_9PLAT|nr:unnamed protein product [Protopolystoma xenopodis]